MEQISKHILEVEDDYFITEDGLLYRDYGQTKMNETVSTKGYIRNQLRRKDKKSTGFYRHRLVLSCFNPVENMNKLQVNHIDGNKQNNRLENLEWCNNQQNRIHAVEHDLAARLYGEENPYNKISEKDVFGIIGMCCLGYSYNQAAAYFGCSKSTVGSIMTGRNWNHLSTEKFVNRTFND